MAENVVYQMPDTGYIYKYLCKNVIFERFWRLYDGPSSVKSIISFPICLTSLSVLIARPILGAKVWANVYILVVSITAFNTFPEN